MKNQVSIATLLMLSMSVSYVAQTPAPAPAQTTYPAPAPPQTKPGDDDVVRITSNLVQVDAVVTDGKGHQVTDLNDQDFEILEDGRPQKITNLSYVSLKTQPRESQSPAPTSTNYKSGPPVPVRLRPEQVNRTIALVVDDLGLSFESTVYVRQALKKFVDEQMQPGDLAAIVRTSAGTGALQQFTGDRRLLYAAIERIRWDPSGGGHVSAFTPLDLDPLTRLSARAASSIPGSAPTFGEPSSTDEIERFRKDVFSIGTLGALKFVVQGMRALPGRKSVILMSDGISIFRPVTRESTGGSGQQGSSTGARKTRDQEAAGGILDSLQKLTDFANRASVVIYTMDARGLQTLGMSAADRTADLTTDQVAGRLTDRQTEFLNSQDGLNYLARQTGGFLIHDNNDLAGGIAKVLDDQKGYYLIGYRPENATFDANGQRSFHHLVVHVKRAGMKVRARTGFFGVTDEAIRALPRSSEEQMLDALLSPFSSGDVHLRLTALFGSDAKGAAVMRALLHIDGHDLSFRDLPDGWHQLSFEILAVTFGDSGTIAEKFLRTETMRVRDDEYRLARQQGLIYTINVPIQKAGAYQLRIAVRDADSKRVGSASQFVEVPELKKGQLALSGIVIAGMASRASSGARPGPAAGANSLAQATTGSEELDPQASPAVRRMHSGMVVDYAYSIYNAVRAKQTGRPQLLTQVRLFRDEQLIYTGKVLPFEAAQQKVGKFAAVGTLQLSEHEKPGNYFLQVVVTDLLANRNRNTTTSWIDFEVVP